MRFISSKSYDAVCIWPVFFLSERWHDISTQISSKLHNAVFAFDLWLCVEILFRVDQAPHQLSIIGIPILHKSNPANISKQRLFLAVECPNDNKRFYRAEKIWEKKRGRQLDWSCKAVCGVCCTESATRVPLDCTGKVLCTVVPLLECIVALPREDAGVPHLVWFGLHQRALEKSERMPKNVNRNPNNDDDDDRDVDDEGWCGW